LDAFSSPSPHSSVSQCSFAMQSKTVVRQSKYRHVFGEEQKNSKYDDLRPGTKMLDSMGVESNGKWVALPWQFGAGTVAPLLLSKAERVRPAAVPLVDGHKAPVLDMDFNPFNDDQLVTVSEDTTIKLWDLPEEGLTETIKEPSMTLEGHGKKITFCTFNQVAEGILASVSFDKTVKTWSLESGGELYSIGIAEQAMDLKWNWSGTLLATATKEVKKPMLNIIDPRKGEIAISNKCHPGIKGTRLTWMGSSRSGDDCNLLASCGFTKAAERQLMLWDVRMFGAEGNAEPLTILDIDKANGPLYPVHDDGTNTLWLAGKGDVMVRYYEHTEEAPHIHALSAYSGTKGQLGVCFIPKRKCNPMKCEVMRGINLIPGLQEGQYTLLPISYMVPRKATDFQEDIFPEARSGAPALTAEKWEGGAAPDGPVMMSMKTVADGSGGGGPPKALSMKDLKARVEELEKENAELKEGGRVAALEAENLELKAELLKLKAA